MSRWPAARKSVEVGSSFMRSEFILRADAGSPVIPAAAEVPAPPGVAGDPASARRMKSNLRRRRRVHRAAVRQPCGVEVDGVASLGVHLHGDPVLAGAAARAVVEREPE